MLRRLVVSLAILAGLLAVADRALATSAGNAAASAIRRHENLRESPSVHFRGFPFLTQAVRGRFREVDVTARDVERDGLVADRVDVHLAGVRVSLNRALRGQVRAIPVRRGTATVTFRYADVNAYLARRPGSIQVVSRAGRVVVLSTIGIAGRGEVEVEGTPRVTVTRGTIRVVVSDVHPTSGAALPAAVAGTAAARASFTLPAGKLPFGIAVTSARLTGDALVVAAGASGLVIDVT